MSADAYRTRTKVERNAAIIARYRGGGVSHDQIAIEFNITRTRVQEILKRAGVPRQVLPPKPKTGRTEFIGAYVHPNIKDALDQVSPNRSETISTFIVEGLAARGIKVDLSQPKDDREIPLPLEGKGNN